MVAPVLSMDKLYNFLGWEELPGTRDEFEVLRIWIDELATIKGKSGFGGIGSCSGTSGGIS